MACVLLRCFVLLSCLTVIEVSLGRSLITEQVMPNSVEKVPLTLYYESLCPACEEFIVSGLDYSMFRTGLIDIVELKLVPSGNAKVDFGSRTVECEHGPTECKLNAVAACTIKYWPNLSQYFPLISCSENSAHMGMPDGWYSCYLRRRYDAHSIDYCTKPSSGEGNELLIQYAMETEILRPRMEFVPWVVVNGEPLRDDYKNFVKYVCKAYKGTPPSACNGISSGTPQGQETTYVHPVCYRNDTRFS